MLDSMLNLIYIAVIFLIQHTTCRKAGSSVLTCGVPDFTSYNHFQNPLPVQYNLVDSNLLFLIEIKA